MLTCTARRGILGMRLQGPKARSPCEAPHARTSSPSTSSCLGPGEMGILCHQSLRRGLRLGDRRGDRDLRGLSLLHRAMVAAEIDVDGHSRQLVKQLDAANDSLRRSM